MDSITFVDPVYADMGAVIKVNGTALIELVREIEKPFADREGRPNIAGDYVYFGAWVTFLPSRYFLGESVNGWTDGEGRIFILCCTCGFPECWALSVRITVTDRQVIWSDFRQIHRGPDCPQGGWNYDGLGPFVFDRKAYELALVGKVPAERPRRPEPPPRKETVIFNLGFRHGANDREAAGCKLGSASRPKPLPLPSPPVEYATGAAAEIWTKGYLMGFECGASDAELAGVDVPGAHGLISGMSNEFLDQFGWLKGMRVDQ